MTLLLALDDTDVHVTGPVPYEATSPLGIVAKQFAVDYEAGSGAIQDIGPAIEAIGLIYGAGGVQYEAWSVAALGILLFVNAGLAAATSIAAAFGVADAVNEMTTAASGRNETLH